jgi:hypothetical protein
MIRSWFPRWAKTSLWPTGRAGLGGGGGAFGFRGFLGGLFVTLSIYDLPYLELTDILGVYYERMKLNLRAWQTS